MTSSESWLRRRFGSFVKKPTPEDEQLYEERRKLSRPLTLSPFTVDSSNTSVYKSEKDGQEKAKKEKALLDHVDENTGNKLQIIPVAEEDIHWSDLLLDIAMTTTFNSLTDGVEVLQGTKVWSYLSFFALVFWIWASQVTYNARFRQPDWAQRLFVFTQLLLFCAMAAFTGNFDITAGIKDGIDQQAVEFQLSSGFGDSQADVGAEIFRDMRLPTLNARGLSITMALSRILLLFQYALTAYHIPRFGRDARRAEKTRWGRIKAALRASVSPVHAAIYVHIGSLVISALLFFIAFGVIGTNPTKGDEIVKLILWYAAITLEILAHFVSTFMPGNVDYIADSIYQRCATVFTVILGGGLDEITKGFRFIVGNFHLGSIGVGLIFSTAIIFISQFTLYFTMSVKAPKGNRRSITVFFLHFIYLSALIIMLRGIAAMLQTYYILGASVPALSFIDDATDVVAIRDNDSAIAYPLLNASSFTDIAQIMNDSGLALSTYLDEYNQFIADLPSIQQANNYTDEQLPFLVVDQIMQEGMQILFNTLENVAAIPDPDSATYAHMVTFMNSDFTVPNQTIVNLDEFLEIFVDLFHDQANPAEWFFGTTGVVLLMLAIIGVVKQWPRDQFEWGQVLLRALVGTIYCALSLLDLNAHFNVEPNFDIEMTGVWSLVNFNIILPISAIIMIIEQIIEVILLYKAGKSYSGLYELPLFGHKRPIPPAKEPYVGSVSARPKPGGSVSETEDDYLLGTHELPKTYANGKDSKQASLIDIHEETIGNGRKQTSPISTNVDAASSSLSSPKSNSISGSRRSKTLPLQEHIVHEDGAIVSKRSETLPLAIDDKDSDKRRPPLVPSTWIVEDQSLDDAHS